MKYEFISEELPERRKIKPEGEYIISDHYEDSRVFEFVYWVGAFTISLVSFTLVYLAISWLIKST